MKHVTCVGKMRFLPASTSAFYTLEHPHIRILPPPEYYTTYSLLLALTRTPEP